MNTRKIILISGVCVLYAIYIIHVIILCLFNKKLIIVDDNVNNVVDANNVVINNANNIDNVSVDVNNVNNLNNNAYNPANVLTTNENRINEK